MEESNHHRLRRRDVLVPLLFLPFAACSGGGGQALPQPTPTLPTRRLNAIQLENLQPGDGSWLATRSGSGHIVGYTSTPSVAKGENIDFMVSVAPEQSYSVSIFRMGWYGGAGGRLMLTAGPFAGQTQPQPTTDPATRMVSCQWKPSYSLVIPGSWTDGIYIAKLTNDAGFEHAIRFLVRDDSRAATFLYQQPILTYQAYNTFPSGALDGKNLYIGYVNGIGSFANRSLKVSLDRPVGIADDKWAAGAGLFWERSWERFLVSWAERVGWDMTYSTDLDTHLRPWRLTQFRGVLSAGHNEYWTTEMLNAWFAARDRGVNLAFFGSNAAYWRVILEPSADGRPNRVIRCAKDPAIDPQTIKFRELGRPEQQLIGIQYSDSHFPDYTDFVVTASSNWAYADTSLKDGDKIPNLVGYEVDALDHRYPQPQSLSYSTLGISPFFSTRSNASLYQALSGAWVFATGTLGWSFGLDHPTLADTRIQRITNNILTKYAGVPPNIAHPPS
ncbi:MAG: hypothetical protein M3007_04755 [Candidatus Eremiobacteraeota bacterium]|nr:hypothetical protein [Candidatus Eremiobacteraeota bacterium]